MQLLVHPPRINSGGFESSAHYSSCAAEVLSPLLELTPATLSHEMSEECHSGSSGSELSLRSDDVMLDDPVDMIRPRGLGNLGNTCYLNAALQALCTLQPFVEHFADGNERIQTAAFPAERQLALAFSRFTRSFGEKPADEAAWPIDMLEAVVACNPSFDGGLQQDAHELLRSLLDCLHDALKAPLAEVVAAEYSRSFLRRWRSPSDQPTDPPSEVVQKTDKKKRLGLGSVDSGIRHSN